MDVEKLENIEIRKFVYKDNPSKEVIGFIAQELEKILPGAVNKPENGMWSVDYLQIIPLMINSIKELHKRIKVLEEKCQD